MARGEYGDVHRLVVQTFMSKRVMPEKEAMELVKSSARCAPFLGAEATCGACGSAGHLCGAYTECMV